MKSNTSIDSTPRNLLFVVGVEPSVDRVEDVVGPLTSNVFSLLRSEVFLVDLDLLWLYTDAWGCIEL